MDKQEDKRISYGNQGACPNGNAEENVEGDGTADDFL